MKYNWESRNKAIHLWPTDFWLECQDQSIEGKTVFSTNGAGTTGYPHTKELLDPLPQTIYCTKINSKWPKSKR